MSLQSSAARGRAVSTSRSELSDPVSLQSSAGRGRAVSTSRSELSDPVSLQSSAARGRAVSTSRSELPSLAKQSQKSISRNSLLGGLDVDTAGLCSLQTARPPFLRQA